MSAPLEIDRAYVLRGVSTCRFYGMSHAALRVFGVLHDQGGNECALVFDSFAPCKMARLDYLPDETRCPIARGYARRAGE